MAEKSELGNHNDNYHGVAEMRLLGFENGCQNQGN